MGTLRWLAITAAVVVLAACTVDAAYRTARADPARCPRVAGASISVHIGGWAEPDWCTYTRPADPPPNP